MGGGKNLEKRLIEVELEKREKKTKNNIRELRQSFKTLKKGLRW